MYQNDLTIYTINDLDKLLQFDYKTIKRRKGATYINAPFSFDIETSSFYKSYKTGKCYKNDIVDFNLIKSEQLEKQATMYMWGFGINGKVIIGRTREEFTHLLYKLSSTLGLNKDKRIIIYIHNLAYEFEWIMKLIDFDKVFALDTRQVCYAINETLGIELRCSYLLSGYSLNKLGDYLLKYPVHKLVGELDYSLIRGTQTPVKEEELNYLRNDNLVVMSYIQEYIERKRFITNIPLTKTGEVRRAVRNKCNEHYTNYRKLMKVLTLEPNEFLLLNKAFQGGYTHANPLHSMSVVHEVTTNDFTSAYPSIMVLEKLPMSKGTKLNPQLFRKAINDGYACLMTLIFTNIENTKADDDYISSSKCMILDDALINNGRVNKASKLSISLTDIDLKIIDMVYSYESIECVELWVYEYRYLPTPVVDAVLTFYEKKTKLKGVVGSEYDYQASKELLNSCYGMSVTNPCRDIIEFDIENELEVWSQEPCPIEETITKFNESKGRFLFYPWGVWITAKNRYNLWRGIIECGHDYIYSDTDSIKCANYNIHAKYFNEYNKEIMKKIKDSADYYEFDLSRYIPKTIKGVEKPIGVWDKEDTATRFKTLGAKRYMYELDNKYHLTCSGINKVVALPYIEELAHKKNLDPFDIFNDTMYIPKGKCGKLIHTYCDYEINGVLKDYLGNEMEYHEDSFIHLENADYSLSITQQYEDFIKGVQTSSNGRNTKLGGIDL